MNLADSLIWWPANIARDALPTTCEPQILQANCFCVDYQSVGEEADETETVANQLRGLAFFGGPSQTSISTTNTNTNELLQILPPKDSSHHQTV